MSETWPDPRVEVVKKLWEAGLSASQIADEVCLSPFHLLPTVSRNAVIGVIHRRGWGGRLKNPSPATSRQRAPRRSVYAAAVTPGHNLKTAATRGNTALAEAFEVEMEPDVVAYDNVIPIVQRLTLMELTDATCKWPIGDPQNDGFFFCGGKALQSLPYCAHHSRIAYQPASDRRRQPAKPTR
jgi:GcrA cell cycle regulator